MSRVAILSDFTADVLASMLRPRHETYVPPGFGAWLETALSPPEGMVRFDPHVVAVLLADPGRARAAGGGRDLAAEAEAALSRRFPGAAILVPDLAAMSADFGEAYFDGRMRAFAAMPFSLRGLRALAALFEPRKALALDCDGVLWRGTIGEDGPEGVVPDAALQRRVLSLARRGVAVAAVTKNNPEDLEKAWSAPGMVLKPGDFASVKAGWGAKAGSVRALAREMNLPESAFVFVDDNPAERAQMRALAPDVLVPSFPCGFESYFASVQTATAEDSARTAMYRADAARRESAARLGLDEWLADLDIHVRVRAIAPRDIPRVAQLSQKTNQFNVSANRYTVREIEELSARPDRAFFAAECSDRFGALGLVAFVQARLSGDSAEIVDWAMSCRAMNRTVEMAVEDAVEKMLCARGVRRVAAQWLPSGRNAPCEGFFDAAGFVPSPRGPQAGRPGAKRYAKDLPGTPPAHPRAALEIENFQ